MKFAYNLFVFLCLATPVWAQTISAPPTPVKPEMPTGPLLRPAPDFSQWEIAFTYVDDQKKKDALTTPSKTKGTVAVADTRPRKVVTTKTGNIIHEEVTDVLGKKLDTWFAGGTQYMRSGTDPTWFQAEAGIQGDASYHPLPKSGFRDMDLVVENNYAGSMQYGEVECLIFAPGGYQKLDLRDPEQRQKKMAAADAIAYIDADTRLPIAVRTHGETRSFKFDPPPTSMQTFPVELATQIRKGAEGRARLEQSAPRPY